MKCGGTSDTKDADAEVQALIERVKTASEEKFGSKFAQYTAVSYKSQVVAGTNYFVKIQIAESDFIHSRIFKPLPHVNGLPQLASIQADKTKDDEIEYF